LARSLRALGGVSDREHRGPARQGVRAADQDRTQRMGRQVNVQILSAKNLTSVRRHWPVKMKTDR